MFWPSGESSTQVSPFLPGGVSDGNWHTVHIHYYNKVRLHLLLIIIHAVLAFMPTKLFELWRSAAWPSACHHVTHAYSPLHLAFDFFFFSCFFIFLSRLHAMWVWVCVRVHMHLLPPSFPAPFLLLSFLFLSPAHSVCRVNVSQSSCAPFFSHPHHLSVVSPLTNSNF